MSHQSNFKPAKLDTSKHVRYKIAIISTSWNRDIISKLEQGAVDTLLKNKIKKSNISHHLVPGAFELVFSAKQIIKKLKPDAVICLGCVIKGDTPHDIYISQAVAEGIMTLNTKLNVPVIFGVLTTHNLAQAQERSGGKFGNKGGEAALSALQMIHFNKSL